MDYIYRADGVKQKKVFGTETTDYLDGFQYTNSILKFFPTAEGYFNVETGKYVYNYTDHLGNVRVSYAKNGAGLEIIEESNYYPFGLKHEGYNVLTGNPSYKYKYNSKELQETGMYDYGARFYMPDIGRFGTVDPRSQYTHEAYSYVWNNPVQFNDPTGMEGEEGKCPPNCPSGVSAINILPSGQTETSIQEITLTGKAADKSFGPGSLAMSAFIVSQADSPVPGPGDVIGGLMLIGAGVWWTYDYFATPRQAIQLLQILVQE
ncbi:RHS repeat domain-containing protein [Chryseobacterium cucumeris]|uniref:RHS repeat domain-containing protein n=1 Tax=Chryseobacterium cucumeris TaxID=1813611 RepID=UPI00192E0144|nr:RHS repeat-associated core domain-containing protein [Chryseobacterium cucumeris]QRA42058.1 RHS repeat-associated core domain-containing protein [Chryseobacterium cucumeris]